MDDIPTQPSLGQSDSGGELHHRDDPLALCLFTDVFPPTVGGAQTVLVHLAAALHERGHRPIVMAPAARKPWDDRQYGVPVIRHRRLVSKRVAVRAILLRLLALHKRHRFDIVHCHAAYPQAYVARTFQWLTGTPYVVRPHGADILPGDSIRRSPRLDRRMRRGLAAASVVIAQSDFMADIIRSVGVNDARIRVIHNGVDVTAFAAALPFDHPRPYIVGIGNFVPHKGFDLLLRAYAIANPSADLLLAGDGPEAERLAALVRELGIADRVRLLGQISGERKVSLYRSARFLVCPSRREPFGNVILEAMASGLPVVATDVGGNSEMVTPEVSGLLCVPESPGALAEAIVQLTASDMLRDRLAEGATREVRRFEWARAVDRYVATYREASRAPLTGGAHPTGG